MQVVITFLVSNNKGIHFLVETMVLFRNDFRLLQGGVCSPEKQEDYIRSVGDWNSLFHIIRTGDYLSNSDPCSFNNRLRELPLSKECELL